jgi:hypothetical protein
MAEVADTELQQLRAAMSLFEQVWGDPTIGEQVRKRAKEIKPDIVIPDDHPVAKRALAELADTKTALETLRGEYQQDKAARQQERAEAKLRADLGTVQERFHFTDDAMAKTIEIMQERQLADPEAAALIYRESLPKAAPQSHSAKFFDGKADMFGTTRVDEQWRTLHENPDQFFADVVNEVFTEMPA